MSHPAPLGPPRLSAPRIDLSRSRRIHVVGIGGPGMSAIAVVLHKLGHVVTGSDVRQSETTDSLLQLGVEVFFNHSATHVGNAEIVTYSTAIPDDNIEVRAARDAGKIVLHRGDVLGSITSQFRGVGVAGTHGKTTTSALLMTMFRLSHQPVSYVIGAEVRDTGTGADVGNSDIMVVELDESDGTAEVVPVEGLVVTNIDFDHMDYFGSLEAMIDTFASLVSRSTGPVVLSADDLNCQKIHDLISRQPTTDSSDRAIITFGFSDKADMRVDNFRETLGGSTFDLHFNNESISVSLLLRGRHNALNCAASAAMAHSYGVALRDAVTAVATFRGVDRRFEEYGVVDGALLIDDYAHIPAEIEAVLSAARSHPLRSGKVIGVFQPNRYHRIAHMANDYAHCFTNADVVVITDIYASGTEPIEGVTGKLVADAIANAHPEAHVIWAKTRTEVVDAVVSYLESGDVCLSMGCGDIGNLPKEIAERLAQ